MNVCGAMYVCSWTGSRPVCEMCIYIYNPSMTGYMCSPMKYIYMYLHTFISTDTITPEWLFCGPGRPASATVRLEHMPISSSDRLAGHLIRGGLDRPSPGVAHRHHRKLIRHANGPIRPPWKVMRLRAGLYRPTPGEPAGSPGRPCFHKNES